MSSARQRFAVLHRELRERICLLVYEPGELLSEARLAEEFGVSRTPIRRVLTQLEAEGLVESRHGHGTVVTDPDLEQLRQVYMLRMRLAELIGELDPNSCGKKDLARLQALVARLDLLGDHDDACAYGRINMAFHNELLALIGNHALREITDRLYYQTSRLFQKRINALNFAEEVAIFRREMTDTVAALERGDMRAVGFTRRNHIAMSFDRMKIGRHLEREHLRHAG